MHICLGVLAPMTVAPAGSHTLLDERTVRAHSRNSWREPDSNVHLVLYDHTFSNLSGMERECARTVRSSSKASNPTFQPLIGSQEPTPEVLVPVIKLVLAKG